MDSEDKKTTHASKAPKALLLIDHLGIGGAQEIVYDLCKLLGDKFNFSVAYFFRQHNYREKIKKLNVKTYSLGMSAFYNILSAINPIPFLNLIRLVRKEKFDIIHIHLYAVSVYGSLLKIFFPNIKIINTIHAPRKGLPIPIYWHYRLIKRFVDVFVSEYDSTVEDLLSFGVKKEKIKYIRFGTNIVDNFQRSEIFKDLRKELNIASAAPIILSVARLSRERHIDKFIKIMPEIVKAIPEAILVIVGDGAEKNKLEELVQKFGLTKNVLFTGRRADLPDLLNFCNVYLTVFENANPMSVAAIQSWVYSKPVVGYNFNSRPLKDIQLKYPFVVSVNNLSRLAREIIKILNNRELQTRLGAMGNKFAQEKYSIKNMIKEYEKLYLSLIK